MKRMLKTVGGVALVMSLVCLVATSVQARTSYSFNFAFGGGYYPYYYGTGLSFFWGPSFYGRGFYGRGYYGRGFYGGGYGRGFSGRGYSGRGFSRGGRR